MLFSLLLILSLYLPFQIALNPTSSIDLASIRVFILAIFFIWVIQSLKEKKLIIKSNIQTWLIITFLFLTAFSLFFAQNLDWSIRKSLYLFSVFPIYFVASTIINTQDRMKRVVEFLSFGAIAVSSIGIIQFFLQFVLGWERTYRFWADYVVGPFLGHNFSQMVLSNPSWLVNVSGRTYLRATSLFPDPHMFSFYLGLIIPLLLGLILENRKNKNNSAFKIVFFFIGLLELIIADALTFSRGGYLGLFTGALALIILFWNNIGVKYKLAGCLVLILILGVLIIPSPISTRFFSSFSLREGSNQGRIKIWQEAVDVIGANPYGVGLGNYPLAIKPSASYWEPIYAHNTYLDVAAETGIINGLIWISLIISTGLVFLKRSSENKIFLGSLVGLVIFSVHSLVETGLYSPVVLALFLIVISFSNITKK